MRWPIGCQGCAPWASAPSDHRRGFAARWGDVGHRPMRQVLVQRAPRRAQAARNGGWCSEQRRGEGRLGGAKRVQPGLNGVPVRAHAPMHPARPFAALVMRGGVACGERLLLAFDPGAVARGFEYPGMPGVGDHCLFGGKALRFPVEMTGCCQACRRQRRHHSGHAARITGAARPLISTFTQAGLPLAKARSRAGASSAAACTNSPCPPSAAATKS